MSMTDPEGRLAAIAARLQPCAMPDVAGGEERCGCGHGLWPCPSTEAAWLARGLDPTDEAARLLALALRYGTELLDETADVA